MPRIIVTTDQDRGVQEKVPVLLDEHVLSEHLTDEHGAMQIVERLGWAVKDAEELELARGVESVVTKATRAW